MYSANLLAPNFGKAINEDGATETVNTSFASLRSQTNQKLVQQAAQKLEKQYDLSKERAQVIASSLNQFAIQSVERGHLTTHDLDKTFKAVFGVSFQSALSAVNNLRAGETSEMRQLTQRSAQYLGLQPHQAQSFIKDMYRSALAEWGL